MLLLFDELCRFMAAVNCAAPTRDALLIEWGGLGMLGLHANPSARSHGTGSCASIELWEPKSGHDACGRRHHNDVQRNAHRPHPSALHLRVWTRWTWYSAGILHAFGWSSVKHERGPRWGCLIVAHWSSWALPGPTVSELRLPCRRVTELLYLLCRAQINSSFVRAARRETPY